MDQNYCINVLENVDSYPLLYLPKGCTSLDTNCESSVNCFIDMTISTMDTDGDHMCIYSGLCNVKLVDDANQDMMEQKEASGPSDYDNQLPMFTEENQTTEVSPGQSQVWIDPSRSPYVYNRCDETEHSRPVEQSKTNINAEQHSTYIPQNIINDNKGVRSDFEHKKFGKVHLVENMKDIALDQSYDKEEYQCGVFMSQLPEEIMIEKEIKVREERKYTELNCENSALKQLLSPKMQSSSKEQRTILFLGPDAESGQTIQKMSVDNSALECSFGGDVDINNVFDQPSISNRKKYQCSNCTQIFDQITKFKSHMMHDHKRMYQTSDYKDENRYTCVDCGKKLKTKEKYDLHCLGHGDPELECNKCHKVFASKFTLKNHRKIHNRKYHCTYCSLAYDDESTLNTHVSRRHAHYICVVCDERFQSSDELLKHEEVHVSTDKSNDLEALYLYEDDGEHTQDFRKAETDTCALSETYTSDTEDKDYCISNDDTIQKANAIIAQIISNKVFLSQSKSVRKGLKNNKVCVVCRKAFNRIGDLKRHLIEHVVQSSLQKTPFSKNGTLNIQCEVCQVATFSRIDIYKAHLRAHAKLTLYKCTFCDKSFSDSSNFSKHKKMHSASYFQCDLCNRKFNSKKMIAHHMEYHNKTPPIYCNYCNKLFYFESMLNKHLKTSHNNDKGAFAVKCRFCGLKFNSLKGKWDHEWQIHKIRKVIADCIVCGRKFRKYSELKRHCIRMHNTEIPPAHRLMDMYSR